MNLIPFGEVAQDRINLSRDYGLIEKIGGIWRLTAKCKSNYQPESYVKYLMGSLEKPVRIRGVKQEVKQEVKRPEIKLTRQQEMRTKEYQDAVNELFKL
ncbi:MAG TPA: hypothetical protein PK443_04955 [bacterium]|nr:hypothetical protein [bacterium]